MDPIQAAQQAAVVAAEAAQAAAGSAQDAAQQAAQTAEEATQQAQEAASQAQQAAEQAASEAQAAAEQAANEAQAAADEATAQAQEAAQQAQAAAEQAAGEAQAAAEQAAAEAQAAAAQAQAAAEQAAATAQEGAAQAQEAAQEAAGAAQEAAQNAAAAAEATTQEAAEAAQAAAEEAAGAAQAAAAQAQVAAEEAANAAQEGVGQAQAAAQQAAAQAQAAAEEAAAAAKQAAAQAQAAAQQAVAGAQQVAAQALAVVQQAAAQAQAAAQQAAAQAQAAVADVTDTFSRVPGLGTEMARGAADRDVLISQFFIKFNGQPAPEALMRDIIEVVVDDNLYLPDMFSIHLHDKAVQWIDSELLAIGTPVEISAKAGTEQGEGAEQESLLIKGEITALEPDFTTMGEPTLLIRGYDRAHRLHRGKLTRSFLQITDSEIVSKVAQEVGLRAQTDPTRIVHDYVFQNNQTNLEFLLERARRIGYQMYVEDQMLHFRKGHEDQGRGPELEWGRNLSVFRPRLTIANQVNEVIVKGWDPTSKREIVGRATDSTIVPEVGASSKKGGPTAQQAFHGAANAVVVNRPIRSQDEAQAMAQALCDIINGEFIQAEGVCLGEPRLQAGKKVQITAVGTRFSGSYFVTSATHAYGANQVYETTFSITGRQPDTLGHLFENGNGQRDGTGMVIGLVTNNNDPDGMGRIKVKFPWLADNEESTWARLASPMAGQGRGFYCLPEVNDEVLLGFEHGDIHYPYIVGVLWNGKDRPPKNNSEVVGQDGKVNLRMFRSRSGHQLIFDDTAGKEKIEVIDKSNNNSIVINSVENTITIKANAKITIQAGGQILTLDNQSQSIQLQGGGRNMTIRGGQFQIT